MNNAGCPYTKISQKQADVLIQKNISILNYKSNLAMNNFSTNFSLVSTANAQGSAQDIGTQLTSQLSVPFYLIIISFFAFVILISVVYVYHWYKFNLGDSFIQNFVPIFFVGLLVLTIPLLFNLLF